MEKRFECVLFDLDGTLIEFHHEYLFSQAELIIPDLAHDPVERSILEHHFAEFDFFGFVTEDKRNAFIESFWERFDWGGFPDPSLLPGITEMIQALHGNEMRTAIVTSRFTPVETLTEVLTPTGLIDFMHHVRTRPGDHIHWTDKRQMILDACAELGISPEKAVMVGDIPTDIESARDVGIGKTVAVLSGGVRRPVLERAKPDLILEHAGLLSEHLF